MTMQEIRKAMRTLVKRKLGDDGELHGELVDLCYKLMSSELNLAGHQNDRQVELLTELANDEASRLIDRLFE